MMFFKRISAFLVDCTILFFITIIVNLFIPVSAESENLSDKLLGLTNDYMEQKITLEEFSQESDVLNYKITKATYISSVVSIVIYILYFVVFQAYNNGQTLGKKMFKIQVLKTDDSMVDINTLLIRCLIPYGILINFILLVTILFVGAGVYNNVNNVLNNVHTIIMLITIIMMMIKSRGIHDYLSKTKVEQI